MTIPCSKKSFLIPLIILIAAQGLIAQESARCFSATTFILNQPASITGVL